MELKTIEEYCRLINKYDDGTGIHSFVISKNLKLSKNTVASTLKKLTTNGFVQMKKYGKVKLSTKGKKIAKKMNFKHRVLETFLYDKLGMKMEKIHIEACAIEHHVSDEMIKRLYSFIGKPKTDPHGSEIQC